MLATVLADLLARRLVEHSIMTEKLARRGVSVPGAYHPDPLRGTPVRTVMQREVVTIGADADVAEAEQRCLPAPATTPCRSSTAPGPSSAS